MLDQIKLQYFNKFVLFIVFILFAPITLLITAYSLLSFSVKTADPSLAQVDFSKSGTRVLASSDSTNFPSVSTTIVLEDGRAEILRRYFYSVDSELESYSSYLVNTADKYGLDYRLLPAIAIKESGACRIIPPGGHNCWGWGIHSAGTLGFDSYEEAIETVAKGLKDKYIDLGYITPDQIMTKYAHPDSTTWGPDVSIYMAALE